MQEMLKEELDFCIKFWEEQKKCSFGDKTECCNCAIFYLLHLITTKKIEGDAKKQRLSLEDLQGILINKV